MREYLDTSRGIPFAEETERRLQLRRRSKSAKRGRKRRLRYFRRFDALLTLPRGFAQSVTRSGQQESVEWKVNSLFLSLNSLSLSPTTSLSPPLLRYSPGQSNQLLEYAHTAVSRPLSSHVNSNRFIKFPSPSTRRHRLDTLDIARNNPRECKRLLVGQALLLYDLRRILTSHSFSLIKSSNPQASTSGKKLGSVDTSYLYTK